MKILQINTTVNSGSTGRIAEDIGDLIIKNSGKSYIAFGRGDSNSSSEKIKIGNKIDVILHGIESSLFDRHGLGSKNATEKLIKEIEIIEPDIIHLHNVHGYYLNVKVLFDYLKIKQKPVVWTFHDCWAFTGHCTYFDAVDCDKWKTQCTKCPNLKAYPSSLFIDNSRNNFNLKKKLFTTLENVNIVTPSQWLANYVHESFLMEHNVQTIHNGIDLNVFRPIRGLAIKNKYKIETNKIILGVASIWDKRKGLLDFIALEKRVDSNYKIILVGLNEKQLKELPNSIIGIARTESVQDLAALYSAADVFVNPTYVDNFPTTNLESLACGTPVITYNTGGSPEAIDHATGVVVDKGDIDGLWKAINKISLGDQEHFAKVCRLRAENLFNKEDRYMDYLKLYLSLMN